jgi:predicted transcriptional regulator
MHDKPSQRSTEREDERAQSAVLALVLSEHPTQFTICELAREIDVDEGDGVERAVRDLVGVGLLRCEGASVLPTRAALHFARLEVA